jgi:HK97 family phage major capsid protein
MNILQQIRAINETLAKLKEEVKEATQERLAAIESEKDKLINERDGLMEKYRQQIETDFENGEEIDSPVELNQRHQQEAIEKRARDLLEKRAISIDSVDLLSNQGQSNTLNQSFIVPSNLVDAIGIKSMIGIETYEKAYVKTDPEGVYTAEGVAAAATEPTYGYATLGRAKITAYAELPEEVEKLAPAMYVTDVQRSLAQALKIKLGKQILLGDGATNHLTGINSAAAIQAATDLEVSAIDENTLDDIIFAYGGDEELSPGVLILSKGALRDFHKVRGTNEKKKVYNIDLKNKTIDGVPYIINSAYKAPASAAASEVFMAYGSLSNYELAAFAPVEMSKSSDYKFKEGQTAYKAVGIFGGNVVSWNGFIRVKKPAV